MICELVILFFFRWPQRNSSESATHANTQGEESRLTALLIIPTPVSPLATHCTTLYTMLHMVVYCTHVAADRDFLQTVCFTPIYPVGSTSRRCRRLCHAGRRSLRVSAPLWRGNCWTVPEGECFFLFFFTTCSPNPWAVTCQCVPFLKKNLLYTGYHSVCDYNNSTKSTDTPTNSTIIS